ncbi:YwlG protein [Streptococcus pneumoniae]|nr:YwlG protein [Streptococcus pneumoniae]
MKQGALFVLGLSSSEVLGGQIGKESSQEIGELIVETILGILSSRGIHLAVQGCEHVNRALVVERQVAEQFGLEIVSVHPTLLSYRFFLFLAR